MVDIKQSVYEELSKIENVEVVAFFPSKFTAFPIISYYENGNVDTGICGSEIMSDISFQIDIWDKGNTTSLKLSVDEKMTDLGFRRDFATDINEDGIFRTTMRYSAKINNKTLKMYKK